MYRLTSTHLQVLAETYPQLKEALATLFKQPVSSEILHEYQMSPIFHDVLHTFVTITQYQVDTYHQASQTLDDITQMISDISELDYDNLSDHDRARLPSLAKEIDENNDFIKDNIYGAAQQDKENLSQVLQQQLVYTDEYLERVAVLMNGYIDMLNRQYGLSVLAYDDSSHEISSIVSDHQLEDFVKENSVLEKYKGSIVCEHKGVESFMKCVLIAHVLLYLCTHGGMMVDKTAKKLIESIEALDMGKAKYLEQPLQEAKYVRDMREYAGFVEELVKELAAYPKKGEKEEESVKNKDLDRITSGTTLFTQVDKSVDGNV